MTVFDFIAIGVFIAAIMFFWFFLDKDNECRALRRQKKQYEDTVAKMKREIHEYICLCSGIDELVMLSDNAPSVRIIGLKKGISKSVVIKEFTFNPNDPEDRDFALRNAKELIEEIEKA